MRVSHRVSTWEFRRPFFMKINPNPSILIAMLMPFVELGQKHMMNGAAAFAASVCRSGRENAAVLPVPVRAWPMASRPESRTGINSAWMGEGAS